MGIPSGHAERREVWRRDCGSLLQAAGVPYKFVVGWPVSPGRDLTKHQQGVFASDEEAAKASEMRRESEQYGDMHFIAVPDTYLDLQAKSYAIFQHGYALGATYVVKLDDDGCVDVPKLQSALEEHEKRPGRELYAGYHRWEGTEMRQMRGRAGEPHPYMSGPLYLLSRELIRLIMDEDRANTVLWAAYGSFDEDAQTGRWVAFAQKEHNVTVDYQVIPGLLHGFK